MRKGLYLFIITASLLVWETRVFAQSKLVVTKLDSLFTQLDKHDKAMCAVLIAKNGKKLYHHEIGYERYSVKQVVHASEQTEYRIGSISKMFAAAIAFQLIEEQKLSLTTKLSTYFPQIPNSDNITIEEMLGHRSGIYDFTGEDNYPSWMSEDKTEDQMVAIVASGKPVFAPGEKFSYSNSNYLLLGYIIEKIMGKPYASVLEERIAKKIGLSQTYVGGRIGSKPNEAASYEWYEGRWVASPEWNMSVIGAAGCVVSTTSDLATFIEALFKGKIVSDTSLKKMAIMKDDYGLGILRSPFHTRVWLGHTGHIDDFNSYAGYFPDDSTVFVFIANGLNYEGSRLANGMLSLYYHLPFEIPNFQKVTVDPLTLTQYNGEYASKTIAMRFTITVDHGELTAQATGQEAFPLTPSGKDEFEFEDAGIVIKFYRDKASFVTGLKLIQSGEDIPFEKE